MFEPEGKAAASDREIKVRIGVAIVSMIFSLAWAAVSYYYPREGADAGMWFARSGAIITVLTLFNESQLTEGIGRLTNVLRDRYLIVINRLRTAGVLCAGLGTLVWGYGDLWVNNW